MEKYLEVTSIDDFFCQCIPPSHPSLLDAVPISDFYDVVLTDVSPQKDSPNVQIVVTWTSACSTAECYVSHQKDCQNVYMPVNEHKDTRTFIQTQNASVKVAVIEIKMSLRICTATFEHFIELSGDERKFKGLFAPAYGFLVDNVWRFFPNATLTSSNKLGDMDMVTMMYDGCLGRLQRNESDIMIPDVSFPLLGKGLKHGTTASVTKVVMASVYKQHCHAVTHRRNGRFQFL